MRSTPHVLAALALTATCLVPLQHTVHGSEGASFARYAVAADHPEASAAGAALLSQGGNAADAAAATMLALGVVSPPSSGLGGGGFALYYNAKDKTLTFLDFREQAPGKATPEMFRAKEGEPVEVSKARSQKGGLAVGVPGEPAGIAELLRRFGKKPLAAAVKPAEKLARSGFTVSEHSRRMLGFVGDALGRDPAIANVFGKALAGGTSAKNTALANTLRQFGAQGPKLFYKGALAKQMVQAVKKNGGLLELNDLANYKVAERTPLHGSAFGYEWFSAPPESAGGYTIVSSLIMLEKITPTLPSGIERAHALIESWKGPYLDRQRYFGDPDQVDTRLAELSLPTRAQKRAALFKKDKALAPATYDAPLPNSPPPAKPNGDQGTSHLCVVDEEGNIASVTTTVNLPFGAGISVGGFWLNNEMDDFAREVGKENAFGLVGGSPNLPAPGKRPVSSMSPSIVLQNGEPILCIGGSGGSRIPTAVEQVALYVLKDGMHPSQAAEAPRLHHQGEPDEVHIKNVPDDLAKALTARGHKLKPTEFSAHVQAIRIGQPGPAHLVAGSDPAKGGVPAGL